MKLLIGGSSSKIFHLQEFGDTLTKYDIKYKLVHDSDVYSGFPNRDIRRWFETREKFNKLVNEFKPDAVFVDRQVHFGIAALKANLPLFVHLRGDYWSEIKWAKETLYRSPLKRMILWYKDRMATKCFEGSSAIFPICKYLGERVKEHYPQKTVEVLYQGIDPAKWYPSKGMELKHPCVGLLQGAWIWGKAREMLTLTKVLEELPEVTFYWAGDGPYRDTILQHLRKFENFKWLGARGPDAGPSGPLLYPDKVREYLSEIDVYALISGIDMSPLTLLEAQLMEKPVVATRTGGIPELMAEERTGFLVEKGDHREWIEKLTTLLNDSNKRKTMGFEGRKYVSEHFSWDKVAKEFAAFMKSHL